ncbi:hypothetical protein KIM372_15350 [Bombiscardovia nodaiensis]|uniref:Uncharacterized protein n=1 Tax=Bombiscardovia nodaiensis TaxID=2932181 RepID=A0ABM8BAM7_9BIFI|nr:hypothetical protein KIM372_15350 [Bombiscardovia nodaiensis]
MRVQEFWLKQRCFALLCSVALALSVCILATPPSSAASTGTLTVHDSACISAEPVREMLSADEATIFVFTHSGDICAVNTDDMRVRGIVHPNIGSFDSDSTLRPIISPDGRTLYCAGNTSDSAGIAAIDIKTLTVKHFSSNASGENFISSANGRTLKTIEMQEKEQRYTWNLLTLDADSGQLLSSVVLRGPTAFNNIIGYCLSSDGRYWYAKVWDSAKEHDAQLVRIDVSTGAVDAVVGVLRWPDSDWSKSHLYVERYDSQLLSVDLSDGQMKALGELEGNPFVHLRVSHDGSNLLIISDSKSRMIDSRTGKEVATQFKGGLHGASYGFTRTDGLSWFQLLHSDSLSGKPVSVEVANSSGSQYVQPLGIAWGPNLPFRGIYQADVSRSGEALYFIQTGPSNPHPQTPEEAQIFAGYLWKVPLRGQSVKAPVPAPAATRWHSWLGWVAVAAVAVALVWAACAVVLLRRRRPAGAHHARE